MMIRSISFSRRSNSIHFNDIYHQRALSFHGKAIKKQQSRGYLIELTWNDTEYVGKLLSKGKALKRPLECAFEEVVIIIIKLL